MERKKVIFLGPVPPPYMGPSVATEVILNSNLKNNFKLIHLDTSDRRDLNTLGVRDFQNVYLALKHYILLFWLIITKAPDMVYIPISQTTIGYLRDSGFILISKFIRRKVICHLRGGDFKNWLNQSGGITKWFVKKVHSLVDGQIVLGKSLRYLFEGFVKSKKIYVVPNGADYPVRTIQKINSQPIKIIYLSNLQKTKGIEDVINSAKLLKENYPILDFQIDVYGAWLDQSLKKKCLLLTQENNLTVYFHRPIFSDNKINLLTNADIFVFPTYYPPEGHPWVIVEAMAAGLPIVSTDQGAITESVIDGLNGFIVEKQNPTQIADKIKLLIEYPELRKKMGQASRRLYLENFTEEKMIQKLTLAFNTVLKR